MWLLRMELASGNSCAASNEIILENRERRCLSSNLEGRIHGLLKMLFQYYSGATDYRKTSIRMCGKSNSITGLDRP
jgi:hypothetical protein